LDASQQNNEQQIDGQLVGQHYGAMGEASTQSYIDAQTKILLIISTTMIKMVASR
jgi:hypothetical protein